jgi:hypothetical protein
MGRVWAADDMRVGNRALRMERRRDRFARPLRSTSPSVRANIRECHVVSTISTLLTMISAIHSAPSRGISGSDGNVAATPGSAQESIRETATQREDEMGKERFDSR